MIDKTKVVLLKKDDLLHPREEIQTQYMDRAAETFTLTFTVYIREEGTAISYGEGFSIKVKQFENLLDQGDIVVYYGDNEHHTLKGPDAMKDTAMTLSYDGSSFRIEWQNEDDSLEHTWVETEPISIFDVEEMLIIGQRQVGEDGYCDGFVGEISDVYMFASVYSYEETIQHRQNKTETIVNWSSVELVNYDGAIVVTKEGPDEAPAATQHGPGGVLYVDRTHVVALKKDATLHPRAQVATLGDMTRASADFTLTVTVEVEEDGTAVSYGQYFAVVVKHYRDFFDRGDVVVRYGDREHHTHRGPAARNCTVMALSYDGDTTFRIEWFNSHHNFDQTWQESEPVSIFDDQAKKLIIGQSQVGEDDYSEGFVGLISDVNVFNSVYSYAQTVVQRMEDTEAVIVNWMKVEVEPFDGAEIITEVVQDEDEDGDEEEEEE